MPSQDSPTRNQKKLSKLSRIESQTQNQSKPMITEKAVDLAFLPKMSTFEAAFAFLHPGPGPWQRQSARQAWALERRKWSG